MLFYDAKVVVRHAGNLKSDSSLRVLLIGADVGVCDRLREIFTRIRAGTLALQWMGSLHEAIGLLSRQEDAIYFATLSGSQDEDATILHKASANAWIKPNIFLVEHGSSETRSQLLRAGPAAEGIVISDPSLPDNSLIYVNDEFLRLTGYLRDEVLGRNCRFLQGPGTDPAVLDEIRESIRESRDCLVELLNYRKDGTPFWNSLSITPLQDAQGRLAHFVGVQSDVTARKLAEERLAAANVDILASNERMKRELEAAAVVQQALLPTLPPRTEGVERAWLFKPSAELAGDQLNVIQLDDVQVALYRLDVRGTAWPRR